MSTDNFNFMQFLSDYTWLIVTLAIFGFFLIFMYSDSLSKFFRSFSLPRAFSIAVIGFPQSGKTCLITSVFGELFSNRIARIKTIPRGKETIERVNADLAKLEIGRALGPTTDQDLFAYRAEITSGFFPFKRTYKIEIGDFPGEQSKTFSEQLSEWFHESEFFKWAMEANAIIFIVDLAHLINPQEKDVYKAEMKRAIRAAWHHLLEYYLTGKKSIKQMRIVLAFTKADLLVTYEQKASGELSSVEAITEHIMKLGFGDTLPKSFYVEEFSKEYKKSIEEDFSDLIDYLRSQCRNFTRAYVSAIASDKDGRLGIRCLLEDLLP